MRHRNSDADIRTLERAGEFDPALAARSALAKLRAGLAGRITLDEIIQLRLVDQKAARTALHHLSVVGNDLLSIDEGVVFDPAVCPTCMGSPRGTAERIDDVIAEFDYDQDQGVYTYSGNTDVNWDSQRSLIGPRGGWTLVCPLGHEWEAFSAPPPPPPPLPPRRRRPQRRRL